MNPEMWKNQAVQDNVALLKKRGVKFIGPASGRVACGNDGEGRMESVENILAEITK